MPEHRALLAARVAQTQYLYSFLGRLHEHAKAFSTLLGHSPLAACAFARALLLLYVSIVRAQRGKVAEQADFPRVARKIRTHMIRKYHVAAGNQTRKPS